MRSKIKQIIENQGTNPHAVSKKTGLTYRIVLGLHNAEYIKRSTPIGTLEDIAYALNVSVIDLYEVERNAA